jgi:hypothetical protein
MPLHYEFTKLLNSIMVEVAESLSEPEAKYKAELIGKARATNNGAAMPIAYKDAALHHLQTRFEKTVDRYLQALESSGIPLDDNTEREMKTHIYPLTSGPNQLHFPPMLHSQTISAVQQSYAMERERLAHRLQKAAANRLKEMKMKYQRELKSVQPTVQHNVTHVTHFNAPVGAAYVNSVHNSMDYIEIDMRLLQDIEAVSVNHPELRSMAAEIRAASPDKASMLEKAKQWAALAVSVEGMADGAIKMYPHLAAAFHHLVQAAH